jgi:hypothetical protein
MISKKNNIVKKNFLEKWYCEKEFSGKNGIEKKNFWEKKL